MECVPLSYNCYIPMPFKSRARVVLRNDTDVDIKDYTSFIDAIRLAYGDLQGDYAFVIGRIDSAWLSPGNGARPR